MKEQEIMENGREGKLRQRKKRINNLKKIINKGKAE